MKIKFLVIFSLFLILVLNADRGYGALVSTFDSNTEGWTVINDAKDFVWDSGGFIKATDKGLGQNWYFVSPWSGDWSSYIGGSLSYAILLIEKSGNYYSTDDVRIYSGSKYLSWISGINPPLGSWTHFEVQLIPANFTVHGGGSFSDIISNVTSLHIRGEFIVGYDMEGLDNVRIQPVPIPGAILLFGTGLIGLVRSRKIFSR